MSSPTSSIFADPRGRRRRFLQVAAFFLLLAFLCGSTYFVSSLLIAPKLYLPQGIRSYRTQLKSHPFGSPSLLESKEDWHHFLLPESTPSLSLNGLAATPQGPLNNTSRTAPLEESKALTTPLFPIRLGYITSGDVPSNRSLKHHASLLTHLASDWFSLVGVEQTLKEDPNENIVSFCSHAGLGLLPILRNLEGDEWQPEAVEGLLKASKEEQTIFFDQLLQRLPLSALGILIEWNEIDIAYRQELTLFFKALAAKFHEHHRELWITIPTGKTQEVYDIKALSEVADHLVGTLYDENSQPDDPGSLAGVEWFRSSVQELFTQAKPEKWIITLGAYGSDWNNTKETLEPLSFVDVMARANIALADPITLEEPSFSPHFNYVSETKEKEEHEVWFLDAITFFNQLHLLQKDPIAGIGIYRLGQEDPDLWKALQLTMKMKENQVNKPTAEELQALEILTFKQEIASIGLGDFLSTGDDAIEGYRTISLQEDGLLNATYGKFPRPACIYRQGNPEPHQVALTFDDGPDPTWTPRILKILKEKKVPATFFILGCQAQQFPDVVQRIQQEGFEFGNHTYTHQNLGETSDEKICLELNATTRLLESITGHSTSLFRPPYNADGNPSTPGELRAIQVASDLGYLTVGESIDPDDWERPGVEAILQRIKDQRAQGGSIILLHDAGGDRSQTVAALPLIIDYLHARGDEIVPLSTFIGLPDTILMPQLREADVTLATRYVYGSFATFRFIETVVWSLFIIATLLSLLSILFFITCTLRHRRLEHLQQQEIPLSASVKLPAISVIIAAYNEEKVIASTIEHLMASHYEAPVELIIVDDGSLDNTAQVVSSLIKKINTPSSSKKLFLLEQPNQGKAIALNTAVTASQHEIIITLDADTMVTHTALQELVTPFRDSSVGGVSGHIRVGNPYHWLGRFQQMEYEFAFEVNRRAQDLLHCITVLPGALSAFRRSALNQAGPLQTETLAEDTDLTLQLQRLGWTITYTPLALADTEAPESIKSLLSQRFRWAFGTLQCLWKHRTLTLSPGSGWLGWFALPSIWVFQVGIIAVTPILDLMVLCSLFWGGGKAIWPYFCASLALDVGLAACAAYFAGRPPWSSWRALPMRLLYRPLLGYIVWKCLFKAAAGSWVRWSKLERTAAAIKEKEITLNSVE